jgi:hypothetical protein
LLSHLPPLPEAASELRQMGSLFPASEVTLDLGDGATKEVSWTPKMRQVAKVEPCP